MLMLAFGGKNCHIYRRGVFILLFLSIVVVGSDIVSLAVELLQSIEFLQEPARQYTILTVALFYCARLR